MKTSNLIHVLLVTLLCFGQLAANIHAVSHLQPHQGEPDNHVAFVSFSNGQSVLAGDGQAVGLDHSHHTGHSLKQPTNGESADYDDCGIYHSYSGLNGVLYATGAQSDTTWSSSAQITLACKRTAGPALVHQQIRAPPAIS